VGRNGDDVAEAEGLSLVKKEVEQVEMFQLDAAECSGGIVIGRENGGGLVLRCGAEGYIVVR
jgi:hypothetical protein